MEQEEIARFETEGQFTFDIESQQATIELNDVDIISEDIPGWLVANEGRLTVALDITVTEELRLEGIAREWSIGYRISEKRAVSILRIK